MKKFAYISFFLLIGLFGSAQNKLSHPVNTHPGKKMVSFYPNPASTFVNFDFEPGSSSTFSLLVFNFMGKKVYELKNAPNHTNIRLEDFFRGIYIYQIRDNFGRVIESGKFQVVK